ncbi:LacI family DNA-binding transcriptional regulator [Kushneria aurantia]|uniref:LacI family DNA-binding transcriptional regulator n=1 Tax=Kushneria aurantia TaxID=504092 RepID=A0ABV6G5Y0_9GAMM|nr:LacI family DNA-binding transcriptional regulator [Kushneria aurantia]
MSPRRRAATRITLKQVAARLGVSAATVSNAFNRPDQLSARRRREILAAARALGYNGPDSRGRTLRTGLSRIIGVVLSDDLGYSFSDSVASEFLAGISQVFDAHDYRILLLTNATRTDRPFSSFNGVADGYLVYGSLPDNDQLTQIGEPQSQPVVTVDNLMPGRPSVGIDNRDAAFELARRALAGGARRPAVLALRLTLDAPAGSCERHRPLQHPNAMMLERLAGFDRALAEAGFEPAAVPLYNVDGNTFEAAAPVIEPLLDDDTPPDLLLCMSDRLALTALSLAEQRGIRVPQALQLTGFDGIAEGQRRPPYLTTVYYDSRAKGIRAARMVTGLDDDKEVVIPTWLIHGQTCPID